jgi:signal transduction histidine kinase
MTLDQTFGKSGGLSAVPVWLPRLIHVAIFTALMLGCSRAFAGAQPVFGNSIADTLTNVSQVRELTLHSESLISVRLEGVVLWVSPERDRWILQDDSGGMAVKMDLQDHPAVQPGQKILVQGSCLASRGELIPGALIDNDGLHSTSEESARVFLSAGLHPISIEWFNGPAFFALEVNFQGPETSRQRIPDAALFHPGKSLVGETNLLVQGLDYSSYEGDWNQLPDFSELPALKHGVASNFDLGVRPRDTNVALAFSGYFSAPRAGEYTFWLTSDDGSKLYFGDRRLQLSVLGEAAWPSPRLISPGQFVLEGQDCQWSILEGMVTHVSEVYDGVYVELSSGTGNAYLKVVGGNYHFLDSLLHSRIKATGVYQNACAMDGQIMPALLVPDTDKIAVTEMNPACWTDYPVSAIQDLTGTNFLETGSAMVHVRGIVSSNSPDKFIAIDDDTGRILVATGTEPLRIGDQVEALGWRSRMGGEIVLQNGICRKIPKQADGGLMTLPLLTKAIQVKSLDRSEALRGYPVRIQGVITARVGSNFVIQDSTWSVFCYWTGRGADASPNIGDYWEIEGNSGVVFAPDIDVHRAVYLHPGILPEPIRPTRDELMNGSLDTQYVEVQGIATAIETNAVVLLTRDGKLKIEFVASQPKTLDGLEDALIRVRGVGCPDRDTNQMILSALSPLGLFSASVSMDEPAPLHPFQIPLKHATDLLFFDARADALRRVRIAGQILGERAGEYFMMDGADGVRFDPKEPVKLRAGDTVDVVGFPDMTGPSPVLREALVHLTGNAALPVPRHLSENTILRGKLDATRVRLESRLVGLSISHSEQVLELQAGTRSYVARLASSRGLLPDILPGSLLELTGVYMGQGGDRTAVDSFELLLDSPSDIRVLARPSWWTFRHTLAVIGTLLVVILVALAWISLLRRQVDERTLQLTAEIKSRQQVEHQRALEAERSRIAQDLHDDLGATLTEIRFLSAVKGRDVLVPETTRSQLREVSEKSRQMVSSLDEIVWAVNPANDSLPSLASYLCHLTEEFFRTTETRCRLDVDELLPPVALTSEVRHNLYLVVREALNNIAKHSRSTEAWLRIHWKDQILRIIVEDNGCGFAGQGPEASVNGGNGLSNMRRRLEKIGGRFECDTRPGSGTVCRIYLPLTG